MPRQIVRDVKIGGQIRAITDEEIQRLIATDSKLMVQIAEGFGQSIAQRLSASHIRNVYGTVKQMEMSEFNYHEFVLLKPKIAYAAKRAGSREAEQLRDILICAIDAVGEDTSRFQRFADFFEAILAYHKAYGGK